MQRKILTAGAALLTATAAAAMQPGEWRSSTQLADITLPGDLPPQAAQMMRRTLGNTIEGTQCVTRADIEQAPERVFQQSDGQCRYSRFDMANGRLDAVAECDVEQGRMIMTMSGTYTDSTYEVNMRMAGESPMGPMTMTYHTTGQRLGSC